MSDGYTVEERGRKFFVVDPTGPAERYDTRENAQDAADTLNDLFGDDEPINPEACPDCGCRPGDGYTPFCPACETARSLAD